MSLAEQKRSVLIQNKNDQLVAIVNQENRIIKELQIKEQEWKLALKQFLQEKDLKLRSPIAISDIAKMVVSLEDKQLLQKCGENLSTSAKKLRELNQFNQELLAQSLEYVQYTLDLVVPEDEVTYQNPTKATQNKKNTRIFDARA